MIRLPHLRLTPKLTLAFVLFAAALLGFIGVLAYYTGRSGLEAATLSALASIATEKQTMLANWVNERQLDLAAVAISPNNREVLSVFVSSQPDSADAQSTHDRLVGELRANTGPQHSLLTMWVMNPDTGQIIAASDPGIEGTFKEDRAYFINGKNGPYVQNPYYSLSLQQVTMTVSVPFRAAGGQLLAVLAAQANLEEMNAIIIEHTGLQETEDAYLVNTSNLFVTQPRFLPDPAVLQRGVRTEAVNDCLTTRNSGVTYDEDYRGIPAIVVYRWLPEREMCLVVKFDQAEAFEPVRAFGVTLATIGMLALLFGSLLAVGLARTLTRPILALQVGVTRFSRGERDIRLPESTQDELGLLTHEFNLMVATLSEKDSQLRDYASQLEQKVDSRTAALQRYAERLTAINRLERIISSGLEIERVYGSFVKELLALVPLDQISIVLVNEAGDQWQVAKQWTQGQPMILPGVWNQVEGSAVAWVVANRIPFLEDELGERGTWSETAILQREGLHSRLLLPLIIQERVVGVMTVASHKSAAFSKEDQSILMTIADHLAIAIQNSRLYEQVQRHAAELEQHVLQRTAQLEASNKELEAFTYSVSHDLRAPLRAIDGFSRLLLEEHAPQLDSEAVRYLHTVRRNAQRMGTLIDDLLAFSRLGRQALKKQSVLAADLVRRVFADLSGETEGRQVELSVGDLPPCRADPALLQQVFANLLSNALKFSKKREVARIEVGFQGPSDGGDLVYFVKDNGAGFDMQYADKLFGVFQRLHPAREYEGTGIGLAIVQRIIHRHGGRIWAEAEIDRGATFYFTLGDNYD